MLVENRRMTAGIVRKRLVLAGAGSCKGFKCAHLRLFMAQCHCCAALRSILY